MTRILLLMLAAPLCIGGETYYTISPMYSSHSYPIFLSLSGKTCLVAGLGQVGCRKLAGLLESDVDRVSVLDIRSYTELDANARALLQDTRTRFCQGSCTARDIRRSFMVFACTGSREENLRIAALCDRHGILCNCAAEPSAGAFILPAVARAGGLCAAISTSGQSPRLAKIWRDELDAWLDARWRQAWLMGRLRPLILGLNLPQPENAALFAVIADYLSDRDHLKIRAGIDKCHEWLITRLPASLSGQLAQIFSEYANAFS